MPTYEYECRKCGHRFEKSQRITEPPSKRCPRCRGAVRRLLGTGVGVIFKGSGFYATDYRSSAYREAAKKYVGTSPAADAGKGSAAAPPKDTTKRKEN